MRECWRTEPKERPTADEIHEALDALLSRRRVEHAAAPQGDAAPPALRQRVLPHVVVIRKNPKASIVTLDVQGLHSYDIHQDCGRYGSEGVLDVEELPDPDPGHNTLRVKKFDAVRAKAISWFNAIDTDQSGTLDREEVLELGRNHSEFIDVNEADLEETMRAMGAADGLEGMVTFDGFYEFFEQTRRDPSSKFHKLLPTLPDSALIAGWPDCGVVCNVHAGVLVRAPEHSVEWTTSGLWHAAPEDTCVAPNLQGAWTSSQPAAGAEGTALSWVAIRDGGSRPFAQTGADAKHTLARKRAVSSKRSFVPMSARSRDPSPPKCRQRQPRR